MIYVVEDDKSIRELVAYALGSAGYETESFTSSGEFSRRWTPGGPGWCFWTSCCRARTG